MKTLFYTLVFILNTIIVYSQVENPYSQFGYAVKSPYVRTKGRDGLYLVNKTDTGRTKALLIEFKARQISVLDERDSVIGMADIPENVLTKFLSTDPLTKKYPELTPYQFASNTPIQGIDLDGMEIYLTTQGQLLGSFGTSTQLNVVTDVAIQKQIIQDAATSRRNYGANYDSYRTSLRALSVTQNLLRRTAKDNVSEGLSAVVYPNKTVMGTPGAAFLHIGANASNMMTPEDYPPIEDIADSRDITIIHSHPIKPFTYNFSTKSFDLLPYNVDMSTSPILNDPNATNEIYGLNESLHPSDMDLSNRDINKGYNFVLLGNLSPLSADANHKLSATVNGAIFYHGNFNTESFRLNQNELKNLSDRAEVETTAKQINNANHRPQ